MLRILRRLLILLTVVSAALFGLGWYRTQMLRDMNGPTITMDQETIEVSVADGDDVLLRGIRASDAVDGDVTATLVVQGISNFVQTGRRIVTVAAFDSDNNVAKATREIVYTDYVPPRFFLDSPLNFATGTPEKQIAEAVRVEDCLDGDLSHSVSLELEDADFWLDTYTAGNARLIYTVINSAGDVAELPVTIQIYDSGSYNHAARVILRQYLAEVPAGGHFEPRSMVERVERNGEPLQTAPDAVRISGSVDTSVPGVYEVEYAITDDISGYVSVVRLPVVVR